MTRNYQKAKKIEDEVDEERVYQIAFARFMNELAGTITDSNQKEVDDIGLLEATYRGLDHIDSLEERISQLEVENDKLRSQLDKLGDIGEQKTNKEQKIASIVTYADNSRREGQEAVTVLPKTIKGLVDVSRRYSYDLVDDMVEDYDWAHDPTEIERYGSVEKAMSDKGVIVDFEGAHGEPVPVNKFTTQTAAKEAAE